MTSPTLAKPPSANEQSAQRQQFSRNQSHVSVVADERWSDRPKRIGRQR